MAVMMVEFSAQSARRLLSYGHQHRWREIFTSRWFVGVDVIKRPWWWRGCGADVAGSCEGALGKPWVQFLAQLASLLLNYGRRRWWREIFTLRQFVGVGGVKQPWRWRGAALQVVAGRFLANYGLNFLAQSACWLLSYGCWSWWLGGEIYFIERW